MECVQAWCDLKAASVDEDSDRAKNGGSHRGDPRVTSARAAEAQVHIS